MSDQLRKPLERSAETRDNEVAALPDLHDRITEAYFGKMGDEFARSTRERIHWICSSVRGQRVLDVGCSQGIAAVLLGREGKTVVGIDVAKRSVEEAREYLAREAIRVQEQVSFVQGDFLTADLGAECFDTVIMAEVLEHLTRPDAFILAASERLSEHGRLIVTVPFGVNDFPDHKKTFYFSEPWRLIIKKFNIDEVKFFGKWIGFVATLRADAETVTSVPPLEDGLAQTEAAFQEIERHFLKRINTLAKEASEIRTKLHATNEQNTALKKSVAYSEAARAALAQALTELKERSQRTESALEALRAEMQATEARNSAEKTSFSRENASLETQLAEQKSKINDLNEVIRDRKTAFDALQGRFWDLQSVASEKDTLVSRLTAELSASDRWSKFHEVDAQEKSLALEAERAALVESEKQRLLIEHRAEETASRLSIHETQLEHAKQNLRERMEQVGFLQSRLEQLRAEQDEKEKDLARLTGEIDAVKARELVLTEETEALRGLVQKERRTADTQEERRLEADARAATLNDHLAAKQSEISALQAAFEQQAAELSDQNERLSRDLITAEETALQWLEELEQQSSALSEARQALEASSHQAHELTEKLSVTEAAQSKMQANFTELTQKNQHVEEEIKALQKQAADFKGRYEQTEKARKEVQTRIMALEKSLDKREETFHAEKQDSLDKLAASQQEVAKFKRLLETAEQEKRSFSAHAATMEKLKILADERADRQRKTLSFRLGNILVFGFMTWKGFLNIPRDLWRLKREWAARNNIKFKSNFEPSSINNNAADSVQDQKDDLHKERPLTLPLEAASASDTQPGDVIFEHTTAVELPGSIEPIWHYITAQPGQRLEIRIATEFLNIKENDRRKAVLLLKGVDSKGNVADKPFEGMSKSSYFHTNFKYLPDTSASLEALHSLIVPEGVFQLQLGLCCFRTRNGEKIVVNEISIKSVSTPASKKGDTKDGGEVSYTTAAQLFNIEGKIKEPLKAVETLRESGKLYGKDQFNLLKKLQGLSRLQGGCHVPPRRSSIAASTKPNHLLYCLHQSVPHTTNGYSTRSHGVAVGLQQSGFKVRVATRLGFPWDSGVSGLVESYDKVELGGITYRAADGTRLADTALDEYIRDTADHFESEARNFGAGVIVAASNHITALPALIAARRLGLPFVYEVRGLWEVTQASMQPEWSGSERYQLMRELEQQSALEADLVITLTGELANELASWGVPRERIQVVPNAVNAKLFQPMAADAATAKELNLQSGVPVIGYAGSAVAYEGLELLMEAMAKLKQRGQVFRFVLVGDGKVIDTVKAKAKTLGIEGECRFTGRVPFEEVPRYLSCMDILPIPRLSSAVTEMVSPLKPLEAMAMGKALVLSDVSPHTTMGGPNGERARLFKKDSAEALREALQALIDSPEERQRLGHAARSWIETQRTWKHVSNRYAGLIKKVIRDASGVSVNISKRSIGVKNPAKNISAISILDEISEECWKYEFKQNSICRNQYDEQVRTSNADFCFLESCWKGNRGAWQYAFTSPGFKHENARAVLDLLPKVKEKMPLLFWNKEDPMHYEKFLPIAKYADVIFTTDSNKVPEYKRDVPEAEVYALPFAAQQNICNPSGRFRSEPEPVCFAGSYYRDGHDERKRQMHALLPSIIDFKGAIYDRFSALDNERYKFPEEFQPYIRDSVPFDEMVKLYKQFKVFLNVNTIVDSPTMMSRRVYELLASGTPVVSTPSRAIEEQFSGIVHMANDSKEANKIIEKLLTDERHWDKTSHLGYREVMKKHTYAHRYQALKKSLGCDENLSDPLVSIVTCTRRPHMIKRLVKNVSRQNHKNLELIVWAQDFTERDLNKLRSCLYENAKNVSRIELVADNSDKTLGERFNAAAKLVSGDYIAKMDDDDFYFDHYLSDMLIPFSFGDYALVGKREVFMYLSGSKKLIRRFTGQRHMEFNFVAGPTFLIKKSAFDEIGFEGRNTGEDSVFLKNLNERGYKIYAADPFNFVQYRASKGSHTWGKDDEYFLSNPQVRVEASGLDTRLVDI